MGIWMAGYTIIYMDVGYTIVYMDVCISEYVHAYIPLYIYIYVHTYIHTSRKRIGFALKTSGHHMVDACVYVSWDMYMHKKYKNEHTNIRSSVNKLLPSRIQNPILILYIYIYIYHVCMYKFITKSIVSFRKQILYLSN